MTQENKKIALCFLTYDGHSQESLWKNFLKTSPRRNNFRIYVHNKNPIPKDSFLYPHEIPEKIDTQWADISLVRATLALFREAIKEDNDYFILLSDKCIPICSLDYIYEKICALSLSALDIAAGYNPLMDKYKEDRWDSVKKTGFISDHNDFVKASQWMVLTRDDASFFCDNDYTNFFKDTWAADEHYFCNVMRKFKRPCAEFPITFANWLESSDRSISKGGDQREFPKTYNTLSESHVHVARIQGSVFMRKIPSNCVICYKVLEKILEDD